MDKILFFIFAFVIIYTIITSLEERGESGYCDIECQVQRDHASDMEGREILRYGR